MMNIVIDTYLGVLVGAYCTPQAETWWGDSDVLRCAVVMAATFTCF